MRAVRALMFLMMLREITYFWLQDCVILLSEYKELQKIAPFSTLLKACNSNPAVKAAFECFSAQVLQSVCSAHDREQTELLNQRELQNALSNGVQRTAKMLSPRLSQLPQLFFLTICSSLQ